MIYRGFYWWEDDPALGMTGSAIHTVAADGVVVLSITHREMAKTGVSTCEECAKAYWPIAMLARAQVHKSRQPVLSVDAVPWEIHNISDEDAYNAAKDAYLAASIHV